MLSIQLKKLVLLTIAIAITGCAQTSQFTKNQYVHVYQKDQTCPETLNMKVGETVQVQLADNPSTGYSWKLAQSLQHLNATTTYNAHKTDDYLVVGLGGVRQFNFKALSTGEETIQLVYTRSWEPNIVGAAWSCKVNIE